MAHILIDLDEAIKNLVDKLKAAGVNGSNAERFAHAALYLISARQVLVGKKSHISENDIM